MNLVKIRTEILAAISSDDYLYETLVLKGGNALNLIYKIGNRSSLDIDYSMEDDFSNVSEIGDKLKKTLERRFVTNELVVFDFTFKAKPEKAKDPLWGGYRAEFKLIKKSLWEELNGDLDLIRSRSISIDGGGKRSFKIEISRREYCAEKAQSEIDDLPIYVYTLPMIVAEKFRAICQQMNEYELQRTPSPRPRDFYDIFSVIDVENIDLASSEFHQLLKVVFETKKVDVKLLEKIPTTKSFHEVDWPSVVSTLGDDIKDFDFYFSFVLELLPKLEPLWIKN